MDERPTPTGVEPSWLERHRWVLYLIMVAAALTGVVLGFARDPAPVTPIVVVAVIGGIALVVLLRASLWRQRRALFPELRGRRPDDRDDRA